MTAFCFVAVAVISLLKTNTWEIGGGKWRKSLPLHEHITNEIL